MLIEQIAAVLERDSEGLILGPRDRRSSVASCFASSTGCLSGAMIELATRRSRVVTPATAPSSVSGSGHGVDGSWFSGRA